MNIHLVTLLSGARNQKNIHLCEKIFHRLKELFPHDPSSISSATVLLANTYGLHGDFRRLEDLRYAMNRSGMKKVPGISSTIFQGQLVVKIF